MRERMARSMSLYQENRKERLVVEDQVENQMTTNPRSAIRIHRESSGIVGVGQLAESLINRLYGSKSETARRIAAEMKRQRELSKEELEALKQQQEAQDEMRLQRAGLEMLIKRSRLIGDDRNRTLRNYKPQTQSQKALKRILQESLKLWPEEKRSFYIWGADNGPGKSHCSKGFILGLIAKQVNATFWRMTDFRSAMIACYKSKDDDIISPAEEGTEVEYLALDDWDKAGISPAVSPGLFSDLFGMFDYRYDQHLPLLLTGQYPLHSLGMDTPSMESIWGKDICDRLEHCIKIQVLGPSGRKTND